MRAELGAEVRDDPEPGDLIVDGDMAYAIAGGRVHAYRITAPP